MFVLSKGKRAVSPVVAVTLLVAIAVGAAAAFYTWYQGIQNPATEKGAELTSRQLSLAGGQLTIESVDTNTSGTSYIYIRNMGTGRLSNFTLYIDGSYAKLENFTLLEGGLGNISTTAISEAGETYRIKVVSQEGASAVKAVIAE